MAEGVVDRVERDRILDLRRRVLGHGALPRDLSPTTRHWAVWLDGRVVGCASVMALRGHALRAMAVAPEHQGAGIGTRLLREVVAEVGAPLWCNARVGAVPFYERLGWVCEGPRFEMEDRGVHQRMTWAPAPA